MPLNAPYILTKDRIDSGWLFTIRRKIDNAILHSEVTKDPIPSRRLDKLWEEIVRPYRRRCGR